MEYVEALEWIHSRLPLGSRPGLIRINGLLDAVDNPQNKIKTVHIGGTNGKGSTVTFLRCLLEEKGFTVGTFTSPFITSFNERISINDVLIPNQDLIGLVEKFQPIVAKLDASEETAGATEFEIITAMMFDYFYEKQVDVAIVEVGLGGTHDCTNVITPLATSITTIGLDHTDILGETIEEIAAQKAGIIKANIPTIIGKVPAAPLEIIEKRAMSVASPISRYNTEYQVAYKGYSETKGEHFSFKNGDWELEDVYVPLIGKHQMDNASVAMQTAYVLMDKLNFTLTNEEIVSALAKAKWAGRMEQLSSEPLIILDGAHNEPAVEVLVNNLEEEFANKKIHIIFSAINTKDISKMLELLRSLPNVDLHTTVFDFPKAVPMSLYENLGIPSTNLIPNWQEGIEAMKNEMGKDDLLLITGSLYFISQVREYLIGEGNNEV